jgi:hypothetical protein
MDPCLKDTGKSPAAQAEQHFPGQELFFSLDNQNKCAKISLIAWMRLLKTKSEENDRG